MTAAGDRQQLTPQARVVLAGSLVNALGTGLVLPFLLIYLHTVRGIPLGRTGLLLALPGLVGFVAGPTGGWLSDRYGARQVLVTGQVVSAGAAVLIACVHSAGWAAPVLALYGIGNATFFPSQSGLFAQVAEGPLLQRMFATNFVLINAGIGVGGLVAGAVANVHHPGTFELIYVLDGVTFAVYAVAVLSVRLPGGPVHEQAREGSYREVLRHPLFWRVFGLAMLLAVIGYAEIDSGLPAFATVTLGLPPRAVAVALVANTAVIVLGQFVVLRRIEHVRRTRCLLVVAALWTASWLLLGSGALVGPHAARWVIVCAFAGLFGLGETFMAPTTGPLTNAVAPAHLRGRFFAANSLAFSFAFTVAPPVATGLIGRHVGAVWFGLLVAGCVTLALSARRLERRLTPEQNGALPLLDPETSLVL
ncbi:MAG TPA: MFS transporter [Mycobacteriales bacterium]